MNLPFAEECGRRLTKWLTDHAERVEVAGSVRRRHPSPNDLDLVVIPRMEEERDIFGQVARRVNMTWREIDRRISADKWEVRCAGAEHVSWVARGVQVDLWWADPDKWGTHMLCRTGSREHNIWLAQLAIERGGKWHPGAGLYIRNTRISATEEAIYDALGMAWLPPEQREAHLLPRAGLIRGARTP